VSITVATTSAGQHDEAYRRKDRSYFSGACLDFVSCLPADPQASILEIGCGTGATGAMALHSGRAGEYVGVELLPEAAAEANDVLSQVLVGDVEQMAFDWQPAKFDALILSEVLEHLREPDALLRKLHRYVRPGGLVLASSPNISHWRVIAKLLQGDFPQHDRGVFDRTHLRWFTPASFVGLFEDAGYQVVWAGPVTPFSQRTQWVSRLMGGRYNHLCMTQICVQARRSAS